MLTLVTPDLTEVSIVRLGGGFKLFFFTPKIGEDFQFDFHIFQMGWFNHQLVVLEMLEVFGMDHGVCRIFLYKTISERRFSFNHGDWIPGRTLLLKGGLRKKRKNGLYLLSYNRFNQWDDYDQIITNGLPLVSFISSLLNGMILE